LAFCDWLNRLDNPKRKSCIPTEVRPSPNSVISV
jgi:hypothetical protein